MNLSTLATIGRSLQAPPLSVWKLIGESIPRPGRRTIKLGDTEAPTPRRVVMLNFRQSYAWRVWMPFDRRHRLAMQRMCWLRLYHERRGHPLDRFPPRVQKRRSA